MDPTKTQSKYHELEHKNNLLFRFSSHFNLEEILQKKYQTSKKYKSSADLSCIMKIVSPVLQVGWGTVVVA
jgi:hypothetical protein